ncbi:MAG: hypothetical protein ACI9G5_000991 [Paracoccaceae bacterium]
MDRRIRATTKIAVSAPTKYFIREIPLMENKLFCFKFVAPSKQAQSWRRHYNTTHQRPTH